MPSFGCNSPIAEAVVGGGLTVLLVVVVVVVVPDLKSVCVCVCVLEEGGLKGTGAIIWLQQPSCCLI